MAAPQRQFRIETHPPGGAAVSFTPVRAARHDGDAAPVVPRERDADAMRAELDALYRTISSTREELLALRRGVIGEEEARGQLGAVVNGTEQATTSILDAAEQVDQIAAMLQSRLGGGADGELAEDIQHHVVRIFEACNFQDLTGQRISRVVDAFAFIEQHVERLIALWGGVERLSATAPARHGPSDGTRLDGPALDGGHGHASQDEIDAIFSG